MSMMSKKSMSVADGVRRLALEHPDWLQVVAAAVAVAERTEAHGGEFAGAWVVNELNGRWVPNLRILVTYGLLEKSGESTRGGRRAYYRMPARREVQATLAELDAARSGQEPKLTFVGTGASGGGDTGRRAGETAFDPPPWR
jgi:hypothetical protein